MSPEILTEMPPQEFTAGEKNEVASEVTRKEVIGAKETVAEVIEVNPDDKNGLSDGIENVLNDDNKIKDLKQKGVWSKFSAGVKILALAGLILLAGTALENSRNASEAMPEPTPTSEKSPGAERLVHASIDAYDAVKDPAEKAMYLKEYLKAKLVQDADFFSNPGASSGSITEQRALPFVQEGDKGINDHRLGWTVEISSDGTAQFQVTNEKGEIFNITINKSEVA